MHTVLQHVARRSMISTVLSGEMHGVAPLALISMLSQATAAGCSLTAAGASQRCMSSAATGEASRSDVSCSSSCDSQPPMAASQSLAAWRLAAGRPTAGASSLRSVSAYGMSAVAQRSSLHTSSVVRAEVEGASAAQLADREPLGNAASAQQQPPPPPWTFTRHLQKRKILPKRMGHMLQVSAYLHRTSLLYPVPKCRKVCLGRQLRPDAQCYRPQHHSSHSC